MKLVSEQRIVPVNIDKRCHTLTRLHDQRRVCFDFHARHDRHSARGHGLGGLLHLHQAHTAVAGDRQPIVVAKARDINTGLLTGLQYAASTCDFQFLGRWNRAKGNETHDVCAGRHSITNTCAPGC